MTDQMKQEFTRRISQANRSHLLVITYEIALEYIKEARLSHAETTGAFDKAVADARRCVERLRADLDYDYNISYTLMRLYNYCSVRLNKSIYERDRKYLDEVEAILTSLHDSYEEAAGKDDSAALMSNAQDVYSGLTYGRDGANVNAGGGYSSRGFAI